VIAIKKNIKVSLNNSDPPLKYWALFNMQRKIGSCDSASNFNITLLKR